MKARNKFSERVAYIAMSGPGKCQTHMKDACDINNILAKYRKTGIIEHVKRAKERYGDFSELAEYAQNLDKVAKAQQAFDMLPAELRNEFKNSIPGFFSYISDEKNRAQCEQWGIFEKKPQKTEESQSTPPPASAGNDVGGNAPASKKGEEA